MKTSDGVDFDLVRYNNRWGGLRRLSMAETSSISLSRDDIDFLCDYGVPSAKHGGFEFFVPPLASTAIVPIDEKQTQGLVVGTLLLGRIVTSCTGVWLIRDYVVPKAHLLARSAPDFFWCLTVFAEYLECSNRWMRASGKIDRNTVVECHGEFIASITKLDHQLGQPGSIWVEFARDVLAETAGFF